MAKDEANASEYSKGLLQSEELYKYVLETSVYPREPESLKEIRNLTFNHPKAVMATAPDAGQFIGMLLNLVNAKKTIEVGVYTGYSLLLTALTIPEDGKVLAIDVNKEWYEIGLPVIKKAGVEHKIDFKESKALPLLDELLTNVLAIDVNKEWYEIGLPVIKKAGVEHKIDFKESKALPLLDELLTNEANEGGFDFAFVDADKFNYWNYHERLIRLIKVGGIIVYDNTLWGGLVAAEPDTDAPEWRVEVKNATLELNKKLAADQRVQISQVALGDGITICRRLY